MACANVEKWQPNLPNEIWLTVFESLCVNDRKCIRLTCRRFYDIANCSRLHASEQIVISTKSNVAAISSLATSTSRRTIWNLKFSDVILNEDSEVISFFQSQGINVCSLIFDECLVKPEVMRAIILHCVNLRNFALILRGKVLRKKKHMRAFNVLKAGDVLEGFNLLHKDGIIRPHVSSVFLQLDYLILITNAQFFGLFAIFPNIKDLRLICNCEVPNNNQLRAISRNWKQKLPYSVSSENLNKKLPYACIHNQALKMNGQLETLSIDFDLEPGAVVLHLINARPLV